MSIGLLGGGASFALRVKHRPGGAELPSSVMIQPSAAYLDYIQRTKSFLQQEFIVEDFARPALRIPLPTAIRSRLRLIRL